jgi:hypothetical protein
MDARALPYPDLNSAFFNGLLDPPVNGIQGTAAAAPTSSEFPQSRGSFPTIT